MIKFGPHYNFDATRVGMVLCPKMVKGQSRMAIKCVLHCLYACLVDCFTVCRHYLMVWTCLWLHVGIVGHLQTVSSHISLVQYSWLDVVKCYYARLLSVASPNLGFI